MNKQKYDEGYQAAIEAIKKCLAGGGITGGGGEGNGLPLPPGMTKSGNGRDGKKEGEGKVGQKDMEKPTGPDIPMDNPNNGGGGFIDRELGKKIAKIEGYDDNGPSDNQVAEDWKNRALKAAQKMRSSGKEGLKRLANQFDSLYKPAVDWKKELKRIVGQAINPDDPRRAYANKNVLISQDRLARTDKDNYDNMSYMVAMVDTSGSMSFEDIKTCMSELYALALAKKPLKLVLIFFGGGPINIQVFNSLNEYKKELSHPKWASGGTTDVKPCFELLKNDKRFNRTPADLVLVFTDGWVDQVKRDPRRVKYLCWVIVDNPGFNLQYNEIKTKCIHIKKDDMK